MAQCVPSKCATVAHAGVVFLSHSHGMALAYANRMEPEKPLGDTRSKDNREMLALRSALTQAAEVVRRTETLLAAARNEVLAEKHKAAQHLAEVLKERNRALKYQAEAVKEKERATKFEREWVKNQQAQGTAEPQYITDDDNESAPAEIGLMGALKLEKLVQENKRLRAAVVEAYNEVDQLRAAAKAPARAVTATPIIAHALDTAPQEIEPPQEADKIEIEYGVSEQATQRSSRL